MSASDLVITKEKTIEVLETVIDPEVGLDVWTMGLIYDIKINKNKIIIRMTLTSPTCPLGGHIQSEIRSALQSLGFTVIEIDLTFDPPWRPPEALRRAMGV